jgi:hypothetical protein
LITPVFAAELLACSVRTICYAKGGRSTSGTTTASASVRQSRDASAPSEQAKGASARAVADHFAPQAFDDAEADPALAEGGVVSQVRNAVGVFRRGAQPVEPEPGEEV